MSSNSHFILTDGVHLMVLKYRSLVRLHEFANGLGLKREWFQEHPRHPHYDLTTRGMYGKAITAGATLVSAKELIIWCSRDGYDDEGDIIVEDSDGK